MTARRAATALIALAVIAACGRGPTAPGPAPGPAPALASAFDGVWQIEYRIAECSGERHCVLMIGTTQKISARMLASGSAVDGVVTIGGENVDVRGTMAPDGSVVLSGARRALFATDHETDIKRLHLKIENGTLAGSVEYTVTGTPSPWLFGTARRAGTIVSASLPERIATAGFTGTWKGRLAVRDCSAVGWPACYPHEANELWNVELTLAQAGSSVSGELRVSGSTQIAVEGTVAGSSLSLRGSSTEPNYAFEEVSTLRPSTMTRDPLGRLTGTIAFDIKWMPTRPDLWSYKETDFRAAELISVALR